LRRAFQPGDKLSAGLKARRYAPRRDFRSILLERKRGWNGAFGFQKELPTGSDALFILPKRRPTGSVAIFVQAKERPIESVASAGSLNRRLIAAVVPFI
jgi:hypothetical protein